MWGRITAPTFFYKNLYIRQLLLKENCADM